MVAAAIVGSAVVGSYAANQAAGQQADAANNATDAANARYGQTRNDLLPYQTAGQQGLSSLSSFLSDPNNQSFTASDFAKYSDPSYQWQLQQGQQALQNSQAAQDGVLSGAALKGMQNYTQGMASTNYQTALNNWLTQNQNHYNQLSGLASLGENAAAQTGSIGANLNSTAANATMAAGAANAAGTIGAGNAITGSINNGMGYYYLNSMIPKTYPGFNGNQFTGYTNINPASVGPVMPAT